MQTTTTNTLITPAAYAARQAALDALTTPALQKARKRIEQEAAAADKPGNGENHYTLTCLLDWADTLLALRVNGYTGDIEN